jgi:hypothetical protein
MLSLLLFICLFTDSVTYTFIYIIFPLDRWTEHFYSIVVNDQKNASRSQWILLMYSKFTPISFGKWLSSSGGRRCLRSYSSSVCIVGVHGLRSVQSGMSFHNNWPHWMDCNPYMPTIQTLLEQLLRHLQLPEDGNHLLKHIGVNLEYINKIHWLLDAFCWSLAMISKTCVNTLQTGDANLRHLHFLHYNCERQVTQICLLTCAWFLRT